jgi:hypothetical protein
MDFIHILTQKFLNQKLQILQDSIFKNWVISSFIFILVVFNTIILVFLHQFSMLILKLLKNIRSSVVYGAQIEQAKMFCLAFTM